MKDLIKGKEEETPIRKEVLEHKNCRTKQPSKKKFKFLNSEVTSLNSPYLNNK